MIERLRRLWLDQLREEPCFGLGLFRIVFMLSMCVWRFGGAADALKRSLRRHPLELLDAPHLEAVLGAVSLWPLPRDFFAVMDALLLPCALLAAIGLCTRPMLVVCATLFFIHGAVLSGWGFFNHTPALPGQVLILLCLLPGVSTWSVDRLLWSALAARRQGRPWTWAEARPALTPAVPRFAWTLLLLLPGLLYAASGIAKLRGGAWGWLTGDTLRFYLVGGASSTQFWFGPVQDAAVVDVAPRIFGYLYMGHATGWFLAYGPVCLVLSWATLAVELLAPVCLLRRGRAQLWWTAVCCGFHIAIAVLMGPRFDEWMLIIVLLAVPALRTWWENRPLRPT